jgi:hypothetical protein
MQYVTVHPPKIQPPKTVKAKGLAHRKMTKTEKAIFAADISDGVVKLDSLSLQQLASLIGISVGYINVARSLDSWQRGLVKQGQRKLTDYLPRRSLPSPAKQITKPVRQIGVDQTLELLAAAE